MSRTGADRPAWRAEFGRLCAHTAAAYVCVLVLALLAVFTPLIVAFIVACLGIVATLLALGAYLELHRKHEVSNKGIKDKP